MRDWVKTNKHERAAMTRALSASTKTFRRSARLHLKFSAGVWDAFHGAKYLIAAVWPGQAALAQQRREFRWLGFFCCKAATSLTSATAFPKGCCVGRSLRVSERFAREKNSLQRKNPRPPHREHSSVKVKIHRLSAHISKIRKISRERAEFPI